MRPNSKLKAATLIETRYWISVHLKELPFFSTVRLYQMGNTAELKQNNMLSLIRTAYALRVTTKPELAKLLNLTIPTVHNFIGELVLRNIVTENGADNSRGGRRAVRYSFNPNLYHIMGVRVTPQRIDIGIFDMLLNCIRQDRYQVKLDNYTFEEGLQLIISYIKNIISRWDIEMAALLDIGITFPGPVDYTTGVILKLPNLQHWENIPAKAILERELRHSVIVEKDSFSNVIGLKWLNHVKLDSNVIFLAIEIGVGIGFLNKGQLYRGKNHMMGEIGHVCIEPNGLLCKCGNRGCLELYASDIGIIKRVSERVKNGESPLLAELCGGNSQNIDMPMILAAETRGDRLARAELEFSLKYIAECIVDVIKLYDPDQIIVGHRWLSKYPDMVARVFEYISMHSLFANKSTISVEFNKIADLELISAAAITIEHQFSSSNNCKLLAMLR
jgi:predicted NBD/HSP70 family sugar kinase